MSDKKDKKSNAKEAKPDKKAAPAKKKDEEDEDGEGGASPEGFNTWPSIVLLSNVATSFRRCAAAKAEGKGFAPYEAWLGKAIEFKAKVKLHGQNGAVNITADGYNVQSRSQFIPKTGKFGKVISDAEAYWTGLFDKSAGYKRLTVFGEFCGPGVQKGVALAALKDVIFCVFGVEIDGFIIYEPAAINKLLTRDGAVALPKHTYVLPWYGPAGSTAPSHWSLDFSDEKKMEAPLADINSAVSAIDSEDPWVKAQFGVKGNGEGLVFYPLNMNAAAHGGSLPKEAFPDFAFKAKGEKHRTVATDKAASTKAPAAEGVDKFVAMILTPARMEQGVQSVGGYDKKNTGAFVKWVVADVQKECKDELAASKLTWKEVSGAVTKGAQTWWLARGAGDKKSDEKSKQK